MKKLWSFDELIFPSAKTLAKMTKKRQKSQKLKVSAAKVSALNNLDSQDFDIFTE